MAIPDAEIHPSATGKAAVTVQSHAGPSPNGLNFYSGWFCPFVRRVWIALEERGIPYQYHEVNPYHKSPEYLAINPKGLVPAFVRGEDVLYDSGIMLEYLDDALKPTPSILPEQPGARAKARILGDHISKNIIPSSIKLTMSQDTQSSDQAKQDLLKALHTLFESLPQGQAFFGGERPGYVDFMIIPFVLRLDSLGKMSGFSVPEGDDADDVWKSFLAWKTRVEALPAVEATLSDQCHYETIYKRYVNNTAQSEAAKAIRAGKQIP